MMILAVAGGRDGEGSRQAGRQAGGQARRVRAVCWKLVGASV